VRILEPRCVAKTFPDYFEALFGVVNAEPADVPVITVDGPTASGKGTLAAAVAARLGYHTLDSGSLYRATALAALQDGIAPDDVPALASLASMLDLRFEGTSVVLRGRPVGDELRREDVGSLASRVAALPSVREALHGLQLAFRRPPGLVADGRDMGTVIFPDAALKVFLTASAAQRASRRHKQLISKGIQANIHDLRTDLEVRDARDKSRSIAPLKPAADALSLDNSALSIDQSVDVVLGWWQQRRPFS
jgi:3-phosphoshikimate 1-carboxyvinyltransferase